MGEAGSMDCGPGVRFHLRLGDDGRFTAASFETCSLDRARPAADALCEVLVGATLAQARGISQVTVAKLGGLPESSVAARVAFYAKSAAIKPLLARPAFAHINVTCACFGIDERTIRAAVRAHGVRNLEQLKEHLPASFGCGTCRPEVRAILDEETPAG